MSFSSRRRNYLLTPHRRDGLIEWMKSMLMHSFVLDALDTTAADTFSHFEMLIDEHRQLTKSSNSSNANGNDGTNGLSTSPHSPGMIFEEDTSNNNGRVVSRLKQLVPTVGTFHTHLPLRKAFVAYNKKYGLTKRRHICISFNELRHILNLAQIMALRDAVGGAKCGGGSTKNVNGSSMMSSPSSLAPSNTQATNDETLAAEMKQTSISGSPNNDDAQGDGQSEEPYSPPIPQSEFILEPLNDQDVNKDTEKTVYSQLCGPKMITFDGDQTLYSDGANFESNQRLANYLYLLLKHKVTVAVVTAAGYEYQTEKYELRLSGLLAYFKQMGLPAEDCERFYLFGGECNYLLSLGHDYKLHPVKEWGAGGWQTSSKFIQESPANWEEDQVQSLLDSSEACFQSSLKELKIRGRIIRKKRSVGLIPNQDEEIPREALDETIIRVQTLLETNIRSTSSAGGVRLPYCAFNGGRDAWVDVGNKRVGVHILSAYLGTSLEETLHIGDQFLNTGNDFAARDICPCIWITSPEETTYILKSILRLAGISPDDSDNAATAGGRSRGSSFAEGPGMLGNEGVDMTEITRRHSQQQLMDVYTGELIGGKK